MCRLWSAISLRGRCKALLGGHQREGRRGGAVAKFEWLAFGASRLQRDRCCRQAFGAGQRRSQQGGSSTPIVKVGSAQLVSQTSGLTHSEGAGCFGGSIGESCITSSIEDGVTSSIGDVSGVGSIWVATTKGALWGSGDISIGPGEEEGSGGVLARSVLC